MNERQESVRTTRTLPARLLLRPRASDRTRQRSRRGGLRSKIMVALGMVLIPAAVIACIWTVMQDRHLHDIKLAMAARAAQQAAQDINVFLRDATLVASTQFSAEEPSLTDPERCQERMGDILRERRDYGFGALVVDDALVCLYDTGRYLPTGERAAMAVDTIQGAMADQFSRSVNPAFALSPDGRYLLLGVALPPNGGQVAGETRKVQVLLALRTDILTYTIAATRLGIDGGTAIVTRQGEVIVQSSSIASTADWFPEDDSILRQMLSAPYLSEPVRAQAGSGAPSHFFAAVTTNPDMLVLTGYPDTLLFATERSILLGSLLPPLIMLVAAAAGALWAVERLVVRWINYLQRVTRVYGSGRLSARALHIGDAPGEIAELGVAFNQMADNIANHALQRERAAEEKETLLRELHHRVKNNFQVIVSLLNLKKRSALSDEGGWSTPDGGLRFIEDHVQAMSVAYRVGYSSGDLGDAPPAELMHDVIDCLRRSAGLTENDIIEEPPEAGHSVDLDRAIGIALYFAAALPAYLDAVGGGAPEEQRPKVRISAVVNAAGQDPGTLRLSFALVPPRQVEPSPLQDRLARAYIRQLDASPVPGDVEGERIILVPLNGVGA
ncbi:histidine kinase dimerization/phosphoacceptor domain -containing protein [Pseudochelatococcus sp. B33]